MKTPEQGDSWGILGGTFDPLHEGHFRLASDIQRIKNLDGVILIPSFLHPFKNENTNASYDDRLAMAKIAIASKDSFHVSSIERDENLSGFTLDTIKAVKQLYNDVTFYFIIGADNVSQLPLWHNISEICKEIKIVVGSRHYFNIDTNQNDFSPLVEYIETTKIDISSTEIKTLLKKRDFEKLRTFLNPSVLKYIKDRNLYIK